MRGIPDNFYPSDLEPVPTLPELARQKMATVIERNSKGEATVLRATPEGQALLNEVMARNAERMRANEKRRQDAQGVRENGGRD